MAAGEKLKVQAKQNSQMLLNLACFLLYNQFGMTPGWYTGVISSTFLIFRLFEMPLGIHEAVWTLESKMN